MGKGDIKTRRGKLFAGSFGKRRKKNKHLRSAGSFQPPVVNKVPKTTTKAETAAPEAKPKPLAKEKKEIPVDKALTETKTTKKVPKASTEPKKQKTEKKD